MTEEEKEAIEFLKALKNLKIILTCSFWNKGEFEFNTLQKGQLDIILNLIDRLQKENEALGRTLDDEIADNDRLQKELERKDKVIDLMAEEIYKKTYWHTRKHKSTLIKEIKEYFYKQVEVEDE